MDGLGDFTRMLWATRKGRELKVGGSVLFPHSLGLHHTALTQHLGFWRYADE